MGSLTTADGLQLQLADWPAPAAPCGTVLLVHGLGEHLDRYDAVARHLSAQGWAVVAYDQRGHGRSAGPRGGLLRDDSLLSDLGQVIAQVRRQGPAPLVLLGHSLGGLVASRFVAEGLADQPAPWWQPVDALVLSSPALAVDMNLGQRALLAVAGRLAPDLAVNNGLKPAWISRDPVVVRAYQADPLVHDRATPRLVHFLLDAAALVLQRAPRWTTPTLLMWAGADRCVAPRGSAVFASSAPPAVVSAECFDALAHEIFNEPERAQVLARLGRWLDPLARRPGPAV